MGVRVEALITPSVLVWARKTAGYSLEVAADKLKISSEVLDSWEQDQLKPSVPQLRKISKLYKRPLSIFYLPEPPTSFKSLQDYRKLPDIVTTTESPELKYAIRRAFELRAAAIEILGELDEAPPQLSLQISIEEEPEVASQKARDLLGITYIEQRRWKDSYEARHSWRSALERLGILVFQSSGIEISEMRGFSINERPLPVISVNSRDRINGKIFTMMHEFVHLLLGHDGMCNLEERQPNHKDKQKIEIFCNRVAGAILVPQAYLEIENELSNKKQKDDWDDETIQVLAQRYRVSRETILRRLLTLGYTSNEFYKDKREELLDEYLEIAQKGKSGFVKLDRFTVNAVGPSLIRTLFNGYYQEKITAADVSSILNVRTKHFDNIEKIVQG
jgi:Zn-dependent peptidase ImmA (M78 family)/DNA-binding XRE family transcriptional regulator